jgi:hypothetical protein
MLLGSQLSLPSTAPGLRPPHHSFTGLTALATSGARYEVCAAHLERVKRCKLLACKASKEQMREELGGWRIKWEQEAKEEVKQVKTILAKSLFETEVG